MDRDDAQPRRPRAGPRLRCPQRGDRGGGDRWGRTCGRPPLRRPPHLLERRVVADVVDLARARAGDCSALVVDPGDLHVGVEEPDGEVRRTLAGRGDPAPGEDLERNVPQPRRVVAVRDLGVDPDDDGIGRVPDQLEQLGEPGRVLGEEEPDAPTRDRHPREPSLDLLDRGDRGCSGRSVDPESFGRQRRHRRVGDVEPSRHAEGQGLTDPAPSEKAEGRPVDPRVERRSGEPRTAQTITARHRDSES